MPGIGDAGERLFNVHYADAHDDAATVSSAPPSAAKKAKSDNGDA